MLGHPGGEQHSRYLIELAFLEKGTKWLDMGAGDGSTVRLLRSLGYCAEGIDLEPRGKDVTRGDYLDAPWQDEFFDGIISQCSFYVSGNIPAALKEASRLLHKGGKGVFRCDGKRGDPSEAVPGSGLCRAASGRSDGSVERILSGSSVDAGQCVPAPGQEVQLCLIRL